jgi:hypothetical protein
MTHWKLLQVILQVKLKLNYTPHVSILRTIQFLYNLYGYTNPQWFSTGEHFYFFLNYNIWLALVSICEIDVTSFSEDGRGVKWLCN